MDPFLGGLDREESKGLARCGFSDVSAGVEDGVRFGFVHGVRGRRGELEFSHGLVSWLGRIGGFGGTGGLGPREGRGEEASAWRPGLLAGHGG